MKELFLLYSSIVLFALGCLAAALSALFYIRLNALKDLPKNLAAEAFDKTFVVFDPYEDRRRSLHGLLSAMPIITVVAGAVVAVFVWKMLEAGLALSLLISILGLNLIALDDVSEIHENSRVIVEAVRNGTSLGVGDLRGLRILRSILPRVIFYYLSLSVLFIILSVALPYVWPFALWSFARFVGLILVVSGQAGIIGYQIAVLLFCLTLFIIQILLTRAKKVLVCKPTFVEDQLKD